MKEYDVTKHFLYSMHEKLSETEKKKLLEEYNTDESNFPKIKITDPAISHLKVKPNDIIKITRKSPSAGRTFYYRVVVRE